MKALALAVAAALLPSAAAAEPPLPRREQARSTAVQPEPAYVPLGLVLSLDAGFGRSFGGASDYTPRGVGEVELTAGYELLGVRPELSFALGYAPRTHVALRPGVHFDLGDTPFYGRVAADWSTVRGVGAWRWILAGVGGELRFTELVGAFVEVDAGVPLHPRNVGLGAMVRAGVSFRY